MEARNPDDIMAECLLAGGKMLSRACRTCGSPLFEVKGETLCVVCREKGREREKEKRKEPVRGPAKGPAKVAKGTGRAPRPEPAPAAGGGADLAGELRETILGLARRARDEPDPERAAALMVAVRKGAVALALLREERE